MNRLADTPENKEEFLSILKELLSPLSENERNDALLYYSEYFDDAGIENEKAVLTQLGSPKAVADRIFEEGGFLTVVKEDEPEPEQPVDETSKEEPKTEAKTTEQTPFYKNPSTMILIIIIGILTFPVWISAIGIVISIIATIFSLIIGLAGVAIGLMAGGIAVLIAGALTIAGSVFDGLLTLGVGLIMFGIGLILVPLFVKICITLIPLTIKGLVKICKLPFRKRGTLNESIL